MENMEEQYICKLKCEMIWRIWKKSKLNSERYGKYRIKVS
jgi:hypothetical protein